MRDNLDRPPVYDDDALPGTGAIIAAALLALVIVIGSLSCWAILSWVQ